MIYEFTFLEVMVTAILVIVVSLLSISVINFVHIGMIVNSNKDKEKKTEFTNESSKPGRKSAFKPISLKDSILSEEEITEFLKTLDDMEKDENERLKANYPMTDNPVKGIYTIEATDFNMFTTINHVVSSGVLNSINSDLVSFSQKFENAIKSFTVYNDKEILSNEFLVSDNIKKYTSDNSSSDTSFFPYVMNLGDLSFLVIDKSNYSFNKKSLLRSICVESLIKITLASLINTGFSIHSKNRYKGVHNRLPATLCSEAIVRLANSVAKKPTPSWSTIYKESVDTTSQDCKNRKEAICTHIFKHIGLAETSTMVYGKKKPEKYDQMYFNILNDKKEVTGHVVVDAKEDENGEGYIKFSFLDKYEKNLLGVVSFEFKLFADNSK